MGAHFIGKTAVATHNGLLGIGAQVMVARQTPLAHHAGASKPAQPDLLTDLDRFHRRTGRGNSADDLMPRHQRIFRNAPLVVQHTEVAVADTAKLHINFHLLVLQRTGIILKGL